MSWARGRVGEDAAPSASPGVLLALGAAALLALALLERAASDGGLGLACGACLALLPWAGRLGGRRPRGWARAALGAAVPAFGAGAGLAVTLQGGLALDAPPGLATFSRLVLLAALVLLHATPPPLLALHGLAAVVGVWTTSAFVADPPLLDAVLAAACLTAVAYGLALAQSSSLRREAEGRLSVGVAPLGGEASAGGALPALLVALLALLPLGLGVELPRPVERAGGAPAAAAAESASGGASDRRRVAFSPEVRFDAARPPVAGRAAVVARVAAVPPPPVLLLRGAALERVDARGFFAPAPDAPPGPTPAIDQPIQRALEVELLRPHEGYLFAVGAPGRVLGAPARATAAGLALMGPAAYPLRYEVLCDEVHPRFELHGLLPTDAPDLLTLPPGVEPGSLLAGLAAEVVPPGAAVERAEGLARWLRRRCRYDEGSVYPAADLASRLETFLLSSRRGICVEFAAAMTVLLRASGVPARVVSGYRCRELDLEGRFVVRERDAHAWVEVPLEGAGWVPFDPTPPRPVAGLIATPEEAEAAAAAAEATGGAADAGASRAAPSHEERATSAGPAGGTRGAPLVGLLLAAVACAGWAVAGRRRLARAALAIHLRAPVPLAALEDDRERLVALLRARGFRPGGAETPLEFVARRPAATPADAALGEAVRLYTRQRFSGRATPAERDALRRALKTARRA